MTSVEPDFDHAMAEEIASGCLARRSRDLAREVARIYDEGLREHGVRASQLNVLVAVGLSGGVSASLLADRLGLEQSTLSRNLARMRRRGWITSDEDPDDPRKAILRLSKAGCELINTVGPVWRDAQSRAREFLEPVVADLALKTAV